MFVSGVVALVSMVGALGLLLGAAIWLALVDKGMDKFRAH